MPKALLIGHKGQDGTYLSQQLRERGYSTIGIGRPSPESKIDLTLKADLYQLLADTQPDEVYFLAAYHRSSEDPAVDAAQLISESISVNTLGLNNVLGAVVSQCAQSRVFYASSSRVFGDPDIPRQNEGTPFRPICAYGISKVAGMGICSYYRRNYGVFVSAGVLYNHESPLRSARFISKKIARAALNIARGSKEKLTLGDLDATVDWGYAPDYTRAMWQILQLDESTEFVIGTGVLHSVRDFVEAAFSELGLAWQEHVTLNEALLNRASGRSTLCADTAKLRALTGWQPEVDFRQMVRRLIEAEMASDPGFADGSLNN